MTAFILIFMVWVSDASKEFICVSILVTLESIDVMIYLDKLGPKLLLLLPVVVTMGWGKYLYPGVWGFLKLGTLSTSTPARTRSRCVINHFCLTPRI